MAAAGTALEGLRGTQAEEGLTMKRRPTAQDQVIGCNIRAKRSAANISREAMADSLDLTEQQLAKYENGRSRICAARLFQVATILGLPVEVFFEGLKTN